MVTKPTTNWSCLYLCFSFSKSFRPRRRACVTTPMAPQPTCWSMLASMPPIRPPPTTCTRSWLWSMRQRWSWVATTGPIRASRRISRAASLIRSPEHARAKLAYLEEVETISAAPVLAPDVSTTIAVPRNFLLLERLGPYSMDFGSRLNI